MYRIKTIIKKLIKKLLGIKEQFSEAKLIELFFAGNSGGVMIDVGVHFGESLRDYERKGWTIFGFEPDKNNWDRIGKVSENVHLSERAVSDHDDQKIQFFTSNESSGISGIIPFHQSHEPAYEVTTITLKTFCSDNSVNHVDFLKIDTEGNDLLVLKGFDFETITPTVILCEFEDSKTKHLNYTFKDLGNFLQDRGYIVYICEWYPIVRYGVKHKWRTIKQFDGQDLDDPAGWGNFIAIHSNDHSDFERKLNEYVKEVSA